MAEFFHDMEAAHKALKIEDPYELIALQKEIKNLDRITWLPEAKRTLFLANMAKYSQNSSARDALLRTGNDTMGEASYSKTWGIGSSLFDRQSMNLNWTGRNIMGNILMDIRNALCEKQNNDFSTHASDNKTSSETQYNKCCWYCGESNHISKNCRHGQKVQCNQCLSLGHKAKFCSFY